MKISHKKPPHFWLMYLIFRCDWERTAFAFIDTVYSKYPLPHYVIEHEKIHLDQQKHSVLGAIVWLIKYLISKKYRYQVELEAIQIEWKIFRAESDGQQRFYFLKNKAENLSGKLYGNLTTHQEALRAIQKL